MNKVSIFPLSYRMLYSLRIGFILLFCPVYLFVQKDTSEWVVVFVISSIVIFSVNNFLYYHIHRTGFLLCIVALDFLTASSYGFIFMHENLPDQAVIGLVGLILFLKINLRNLVFGWFSLIVVYWIVLLTAKYYFIGKIDPVAIIVNSSFIIFLSFIGSLIRYYQQARDEAAELNIQLHDYATQIEGLATARERNRIAREIHDSIGHMLTSLLVQLQVTRKLYTIDPNKSFETMLKCEQLARAALQEVRLSVRAMKEGDWKESVFLDSLQTLINDFSAITNMNVNFYTSGIGRKIGQPIQLSIFRIVQEFLTNAHKHGNANLTTIHLDYTREIIEILLQDNGVGTNQFVEGNGLLNMKERIEEHGGNIQISSSVGNGFEVEIAIPNKLFHMKGE